MQHIEIKPCISLKDLESCPEPRCGIGVADVQYNFIEIGGIDMIQLVQTINSLIDENIMLKHQVTELQMQSESFEALIGQLMNDLTKKT